ncbi:MAG: four helix bundle protein [Methanobacteriota archaeon]|nr:MAG: four helix bundle protein [Euryarchaeota archaeon]
MSASFEDLQVWKKASSLVVKLYKLLQDKKDYFLKDQILRSAISIPSNIAEGSERGSDQEFKRFLNIAKGSAAELRTQLYIARKIGYVNDRQLKEVIDEVREISRMIQSLQKKLNKI